MHNIKATCLFIFIFCFINACSEDPVPKPHGYFRIDLPEKKYSELKTDCPFAFEYPVYSVITRSNANDADPCWLNIAFPKYNAQVHLSYKRVDNNLVQYLEDSRTLAFKHTVKANDIREIPIIIDSTKVYGLVYDIRGNAASSLQFYLTDSTTHFLRGSLYFNSVPNSDSIAPVLEFISKDVQHLIETFRWE